LASAKPSCRWVWTATTDIYQRKRPTCQHGAPGHLQDSTRGVCIWRLKSFRLQQCKYSYQPFVVCCTSLQVDGRCVIQSNEVGVKTLSDSVPRRKGGVGIWTSTFSSSHCTSSQTTGGGNSQRQLQEDMAGIGSPLGSGQASDHRGGHMGLP
jgi:hypothetical protein